MFWLRFRLRPGLRSVLAALAFLTTLLSAVAEQPDEQSQLVADFRQAEGLRGAGRNADAARMYASITTRAERLFGSEHEAFIG